MGLNKKMSGEGFLPGIHSPPHYQVILEVSYVFKSLLNNNILNLKTFIGFCRHMVKCCHSIFFLTCVILYEVTVNILV